MIRTACAAVAAVAALLPAAASAAEPKDLVTVLYGQRSITGAAEVFAGYFAQDLGAALRARRTASAGFDYRYGVQDPSITDLEILQEVDNDQARVVAVFKNRGRANSVDWTMCRGADGDWRIADASSNSGQVEWDLRRLLSLPEEVRC